MRASFSAELFKLRKRSANWALLAFWLVLNMVFSYLVPYTSYLSGGGASGQPPEQVLADALPANMIFNAVAGIPVFAGALALILGALSMGSEYGYGTLPVILTQRPRRLSVFDGKVLALAVTLGVVIVVTFAVNALVSWTIATVEAQPVNWPPAVDILQGIGAGWLITFVWCMFGLFLATVLRGVALPIGLGIIWIVGVQNVISGVAAPLLEAVQTLQQGLPGANAGSLVAALFGDDGSTPGIVSVVGGTQAAITLVAYCVLFAAVAALTLRNRDVT